MEKSEQELQENQTPEVTGEEKDASQSSEQLFQELRESQSEAERSRKKMAQQASQAGLQKNNLWRDIISYDPPRLAELMKQDARLADKISHEKWGVTANEFLSELNAPKEEPRREEPAEKPKQSPIVQEFRKKFVDENADIIRTNEQLGRELLRDYQIFEQLEQTNPNLATAAELERMWTRTVQAHSTNETRSRDMVQAIRGEFNRSYAASPRGNATEMNTGEKNYELKKEWEEISRSQKEAGMKPTSFETFKSLRESGKI